MYRPYRPVAATEDMHEKAPQVVSAEQPGLEFDQRAPEATHVPVVEPKYSPPQLPPPPPPPPKAEEPTPQHEPRRAHARTSLFGLGAFASGLIVGLLVAIVIGAAVGGGLGATLTSCHGELQAVYDELDTATSSLSAIESPTATTTDSSTESPTESAEDSATTTGTVTTGDAASATETAAESSAESSTGTRPRALFARSVPTGSPARYAGYSAAAPQTIRALRNDCLPTTNHRTLWGDSYTTACDKDIAFGLPGLDGGAVVDIAGIYAYSFSDCMEACSGLNNRARKWGFPTSCHAVSWNRDMATAVTNQYANCWLKNGTLADRAQALSDTNVMSAFLDQRTMDTPQQVREELRFFA